MQKIFFVLQYILDILQFKVYNINCKGGKNKLPMKNKKMKIARMEHDMNQEDLAQIVGVTRQTIGLIESGNYNPTLNLCMAICDALDRTLDELFWIPKEERMTNNEK